MTELCENMHPVHCTARKSAAGRSPQLNFDLIFLSVSLFMKRKNFDHTETLDKRRREAERSRRGKEGNRRPELACIQRQ